MLLDIFVVKDYTCEIWVKPNKFFKRFIRDAKDYDTFIFGMLSWTDEGEPIIYLNEDANEVLPQVLAHELGHLFHDAYELEDSETLADDFAFDLCVSLGYNTAIFHEWAKDNGEID